MRPIWVSFPVATTMPAAVPLMASVPAKARFRRSCSGTSPCKAWTDFATGTDSPVRAASSTWRFFTRHRRRSRRHLVAAAQEHGIAGHQLGRRQAGLSFDRG